ncbi:TPA: ABC transporter ATP-binding protein [Proteus mirabilis]|uniref:ABC transporter ATP-binding protein n=1 Tax=Proteus mirabilis TaxID=584 RepID=UPI000DE8ADDD|nr:ABC transporter ATP-binding protein [Proteus mirabilis]MBG2833330.1 ABC transporter ATP-binding protein [Proteus mirabilis]MBG2886571.1 ABC transporter ATP-binding protein [Proteus mirabilis]MBI6248640.1 ABC transporter ATP-binding protein [Proteus mirabilis]RCE56231.1 ABC transporter ATP-binding protein [Proteus mirabilis]SUC09489.1 siderophore ABC transporter ATP-binding/permease [Proteus mirabilis]
MIKELIKSGYLLSNKKDKDLMVGLCLAVVEGLFATIPYILLYFLLIDLFANKITLAQLFYYFLSILLSIVLRIVIGTYSMPMIFIGAYKMMGQARLRIADHLRKIPIGWFSSQRSGDLASRLTADLEIIENIWSHFLGMFISTLAMPVFLSLFLVWVDWQLTLIILFSIPIALFALSISHKIMLKAAQQAADANANVQSELLDYIQGIMVIRSFGRLGPAWKKLKAALETQNKTQIVLDSKPAPWIALYGFILESGFILLMIIGTSRLISGSLSPSQFVFFLVLALPIYRQFFDLGLSSMLLNYAQKSLQRIEEVMKVVPLSEPIYTQLPIRTDIYFNNVSFVYPYNRQLTLDNISCCFPEKSFTAIVGPSGSGKSTLLQLISRLWDVNQGEILLGDININQINSDKLCSYVSSVYQDVVLFSGTIKDNILMGKTDAHDDEIITAAKLANAHEFIMQKPQNYDTPIGYGGLLLSGGERQRLSLARTLLKNAPILLIDEATSSIDCSSEVLIQQALSLLSKDKTIIMIAHRLNSIKNADNIIVMENGKIVEQGKHAELLAKNGLYAHLWLQQKALC